MSSSADVPAGPPGAGARPLPEWTHEFFTAKTYRRFRAVARMYGARNVEEADDAVNSMMELMIKYAAKIEFPIAYAELLLLRMIIRQNQRSGRVRHGEAIVGLDLDQANFYGQSSATVEGEAWVAYILKLLPEQQQRVMALTYDGLTPSDIAEVLHQPLTNITSTLYEARRALKGKDEVKNLHRRVTVSNAISTGRTPSRFGRESGHQ